MYPVPNKPHVTKVQGGVSNISGSHETLMISNGEQRLWLQEGNLFNEGGKLPDPIPGWFWEEFSKLTPAMQERHGAVNRLKYAKQPEQIQSGRTDTEQDNPGKQPALKKGDLSDQGGDPNFESKPPEQLTEEMRVAQEVHDALDVMDEQNEQRAERQEADMEGQETAPVDQTDEEALEQNTVAELKGIAADEEVELDSGDRKADIIRKILDNRAKRD